MRTPRILVIDDWMDHVIDFVELLIVSYNALVDICTSGIDGFDKLKYTHYDFIIIDQNLSRTGLKDGSEWKSRIELDYPQYKGKIMIVSSLPYEGVVKKIYAKDHIKQVFKKLKIKEC